MTDTSLKARLANITPPVDAALLARLQDISAAVAAANAKPQTPFLGV